MQRAVAARLRGVAIVLLVTTISAPATAQLQLSERFALTQVIDSVNVTLRGYRPNARGRDIFGKTVKWGRSWVAGANYPTTLDVGRDFQVNGTKVPAGTYSLWVVPRENDDWSLIIDPRTKLNHWDDPDSTSAQYHAKLKVSHVDSVETLTWSMPQVSGYKTTVRMAWGTRAAEFTLAVKPSLSATVSPAVAAEIVGDYILTPDTARYPKADAVRLSYADSTLAVRFVGGEFGDAWGGEPGTTMVLVPSRGKLFVMGITFHGELVNVMSESVWTFSRAGGRVTGFEARDRTSDKLWMAGTRKP